MWREDATFSIAAAFAPTSPAQGPVSIPARPPSGRLLLAVWIGLVLIVALLGVLSFQYREREIRQAEVSKLASIAALKAGQVEDWLRERRIAVKLAMSDRAIGRAAAHWLATGEPVSRDELAGHLEDVRAVFDCESLFLMDAQGQLRLFVGQAPKLTETLRESALRALQQGQAVLGDVRRDPEGAPHDMHLDFVAPVVDGERAIGVLVLRSNARTSLFPVIQTWPVPSATSEAVLVRREGDAVVYLNDLWHRADAALNLRVPLEREMPPVVRALLNPEIHQGVGEARDYRDEEVLVAARAIAGTPWVMVAKTDRAEIYGDLRRETLLVSLLIVVAILAAGGCMGFFWRQQRLFFVRSSQCQATAAAEVASHKYIAEREQVAEKMAEQRDLLETILTQAAEGIVVCDARGKLTLLNPAARRLATADSGGQLFLDGVEQGDMATALAGWGHVYDSAGGEPLAIEQTPLVIALGGTTVVNREIHLQRLDGRQFDLLTSAAPLRDAHDHIIGAVATFSDITERKRVQNDVVEAEAKFRALVEQSIAGIYILDDERILYANPRFAEIFGYSPDEVVGLDALAIVAGPDRARVRENIRKRLADEAHGVQSTFLGQRRDGSLVEIGAHGIATIYRGRPAIIGILQDIGERRQAERQIQEYIDRLERAMLSTVEAVAMMSELRDPYTSGHEHRVGDLAAAIGQEMGLPADTIKGLRIIGSVHDIGKITIPAEILSKPGRLSKLEFDIVKTHAQQGYEILKAVEFPWPVAQAILQHHERLDGSGYPHGLSAEDIMLEARVIAVADVVEAMASHRPYRPGLGVDAALAEITQFSGHRYDSTVVMACVSLFRDKHYVFKTWPNA